MKKWVNWSIFAVVGLILAVGTLLFHSFLFPIAIRYQVTKTLELVNGTDSWDRFVVTPIPLILKVYFFRLDNPDGVLSGEKPKVTQVGPYVYREHWEKVDITVDEEMDRVFYRQKVKYTFDKELSGGLSDTDNVTIINPIIHMISGIIDGFPTLNLTNQILEFGLPEIIGGYNGPSLTATVRELLLDGLRIKCSIKGLSFTAKLFCSSLTHFLPLPNVELAPNGDLITSVLKFKELSPLLEMKRGVKFPEELGKIVSMDGERHLGSWWCESSNVVDGFDMTTIAPFLTRTTLPLFVYDLRTTMEMVYREDIEFSGITGYRFVMGPDLLGDPARNVGARCYCPGSAKNLTTPRQCMEGHGVVDTSSVFGNEGGVQTLHGRGTGSGKVTFSSGKSVLFAMNKSREMTTVVFRAYAADEFLGESIKVFKGPTFPKRSDVGEPGSFTFGADLGFKKNGAIIGATKAFIRMTAFGENIVSECIKHGDSYRVRMTSLIMETSDEPRRNLRPWWVVLDGRRLRFSRWLKALEKENCTKEVYLKVKKSSQEDSVPSCHSDTLLDAEEMDFMESAEASLKRDFNCFREFGYPRKEDKGSQIDLEIEESLREVSALPLNILKHLLTESRLTNDSFSLRSLENESTHINLLKKCLEKDMEIATLLTSNSGHTRIIQPDNENNDSIDEETVKMYSKIEPTMSAKIDEVNKPIEEENDLNYVERNDGTSVINVAVKSDDIFHFEGSASDIIAETVSQNTSPVISLFSDEKFTKSEVIETPTVTEKSFFAETIMREIIDIPIERIFETEYNSSLQGKTQAALAVTVDGTCRVTRDIGHGDIESSVELSALGITETPACIELSTATALDLTMDAILESTKCQINNEMKVDKDKDKGGNLATTDLIAKEPYSELKTTTKSNDYIISNEDDNKNNLSAVFNNTSSGIFAVHNAGNKVICEKIDPNQTKREVHFVKCREENDGTDPTATQPNRDEGSLNLAGGSLGSTAEEGIGIACCSVEGIAVEATLQDDVYDSKGCKEEYSWKLREPSRLNCLTTVKEGEITQDIHNTGESEMGKNEYRVSFAETVDCLYDPNNITVSEGSMNEEAAHLLDSENQIVTATDNLCDGEVKKGEAVHLIDTTVVLSSSLEIGPQMNEEAVAANNLGENTANTICRKNDGFNADQSPNTASNTHAK